PNDNIARYIAADGLAAVIVESDTIIAEAEEAVVRLTVHRGEREVITRLGLDGELEGFTRHGGTASIRTDRDTIDTDGRILLRIAAGNILDVDSKGDRRGHGGRRVLRGDGSDREAGGQREQRWHKHGLRQTFHESVFPLAYR